MKRNHPVPAGPLDAAGTAAAGAGRTVTRGEAAVVQPVDTRVRRRGHRRGCGRGRAVASAARLLATPPPPRPCGPVLALRGHQAPAAAGTRRVQPLAVLRGRRRRAALPRAVRRDVDRRAERLEPVHVPDADRNAWYRTVFSMATLALAMQAAGQVFVLLRAGQDTVAQALVVPLAAMALVYFVINTGLVAGAIAVLDGRGDLRRLARELPLERARLLHGRRLGRARRARASTGRPTRLWVVLVVVPAFLTFTGATASSSSASRRSRPRCGARRPSSSRRSRRSRWRSRPGTAPPRCRFARCRRTRSASRARSACRGRDPGLQTATLLHDIGNLAVPEHIFSKPGPLTFEEFQKVKTHPLVGAEILKDVPFPYPVAALIAAHHEHWDGKGYPQGLKGEQIPLGARVLAVVDSYAALTSHRPHRPARPYHEALATLRQTAGSILDPTLVEIVHQRAAHARLPVRHLAGGRAAPVGLRPPTATADARAPARSRTSPAPTRRPARSTRSRRRSAPASGSGSRWRSSPTASGTSCPSPARRSSSRTRRRAASSAAGRSACTTRTCAR